MTPKQEAFARKYVECGNASEAYRTAYNVGKNTKPETVWNDAHKLLLKPEVAARVMELQNKAAERTIVTVESLTEELNEARELAVRDEDPSELRQNTMAKAKLHGLDVHKVDVKGNVNVTITGDDADL